MDCVPDVIVTLAVLTPCEAYGNTTELPVPVSPSVPLHAYVYVPVPPLGTAVQVAEDPTEIEEGETEHDAVSVG
jgi:hypothetical protein